MSITILSQSLKKMYYLTQSENKTNIYLNKSHDAYGNNNFFNKL